jgi:hypothetical protein
MKCPVLFVPHTQAVKLRFYRRSNELLATDAEWTLCFSFIHIEVYVIYSTE